MVLVLGLMSDSRGNEVEEMKDINWKRKITSRKLWFSVASFVSMLIVANGGTESEAAQVAAIIMAGATVIGYVVGEGLTDAAHGFDGVDVEFEEMEE